MSERYLESHEWARPEGTAVVIGLSPFAAGEVGEIIHVELPAVGSTVTRGQPMGEIESVKSVNDIYSPVTGTVIAINEALRDHPELVNQEPLAGGWFIRVSTVGGDPLEGLLDAAGYQQHIGA